MNDYSISLLFIPVLILNSCANEAMVTPAQSAWPITAAVESTPVRSVDDAADDPAIWVNEVDLEASRVIGTDKNYGIEVYSLEGERLQSIPAGRTNNVDLRRLKNAGRWSALAAASNRTNNTISLFLIDSSGELFWLEESEIATGLAEPYGLCMFENASGLQVFVNDKDGRYQQWMLDISGLAAGDLRVSGKLVREFSVSSQPEGCVADDEHQRLFIGIESEGLRWLSAHHDSPTRLYKIADIDGQVLVADVEGMSIFEVGSRGFLIVSSQGNNSYAVYNRLPPFGYRGSVVVTADTENGIDGTSETDGLDASSLVRTKRYPQGLVVVQDGSNTAPNEAQNFKFIPWDRISRTLGL